ncbi:MAG TPA: type II toxin-antitoxin system Phd/YefM family antitoxin [Thermomicrobiales bacterium]|nr:type II toxin-antitoxin system Phd/YefM family antitoxin [Thermomicrobiales bacterium]
MLKVQRKSISANAAKQRWGSLMGAVEKDGDRVVVESHGKPKVAVVPVHDLERLEALDEREHREEALRRLRALEKKATDRNQELTEEDIEELSVQVGREINRRASEKQREMSRHPQQR